jgi:outer membrane receptor for ferrienterochelin and colicin
MCSSSFRARALCALFAFFPLCAPAAQTTAIAGTVIDQSTGLALAGARITTTPATSSARSDAQGRFVLAVSAGRYVILAQRDGYQPSASSVVPVAAGERAQVTLALERATNDLTVIGHTSVRASSTLRKSGTFYRTLDVERLQRGGTVRAADALRALPGVNNGITGDTGNFADDVNVNIRGLGTLETQATLDGHPIGYGFPGGYNYDLSPVFALRNIEVTYGSGAQSLTGLDAIGGVVDFQTLDPAQQPEFSAMQGIGTFQNRVTAVRATGTTHRLGYAAAYGVSHIDGPMANQTIYQPGAAFDQSSTLPQIHALGIYTDDSTAVSRSGLAKIAYAMGAQSSMTFTALSSSMWDDKTGNGDGDYLAYAPAFTFGQHLLAVKGSNDPCPQGTFTATNANGAPNGTGPDGNPDGGIRCQTPQQWAAFNAGYQGAGPAWQAFNLQDEHLNVTAGSDAATFSLDAYTSRFAHTFDRTWQLPFKRVPGDRALWRNRQVVETGAVLSGELHAARSDFGFGLSWMNDAYALLQRGASAGTPLTHETAVFVREAYHPAPKVYAYANAWFKHASATRSAYVDPRVSLVYAAGTNDVIRFATGKTTAQPTADMLGKSFVESPPGNAGGGASITCSGLNSIGTAPSSLLRPERGVDRELAYAHRFAGDTQVQLSLYNVDVYDKLYSTLAALSTTGTAFIDPAYLSQVSAIVAAKCGSANVRALLGVSGTLNVGDLRSRGFTLDGRWRLSPQTYVDYDWALTSTSIVSAPQSLLQANKTLIAGRQLPHLPLHTLDLSLDHTFTGGFDVRYTLHTVSDNNTKALPAYDYSDLTATCRSGNGVFALTVGNIFNKYADNRGLRYEGVPLALNQYASAADYAPVIGAASTERFGLPPRTIFFSYTAALH